MPTGGYSTRNQDPAGERDTYSVPHQIREEAKHHGLEPPEGVKAFRV